MMCNILIIRCLRELSFINVRRMDAEVSGMMTGDGSSLMLTQGLEKRGLSVAYSGAIESGSDPSGGVGIPVKLARRGTEN